MKTIRNKLDFRRRADLSCNFLTRMTDEKLDLLPYWLVAIDENPAWAQSYGVQGIPTMLFVAQGKIVHQQVGAVPEPYLRDMVDEFLRTVAALSGPAKN